ncbi:MAG TPA: Xaa-Pro peptidase family protein [Candidatus Saccharimonadales bacterium]|nr:Xaa-Pro peptidase family protein [Candidatus Saccharimonadales bacterium]
MTIPREPAFGPEEYQTRLQRVRQGMAERDLDGLLLFAPHPINYLSGMDSENLFDFQCLIVPLNGTPTLVILDFEEARAENSVGLGTVVSYRAFDDPITAVVDQVRALGLAGGRLGLEQRAGITPAAHGRFVEELAGTRLEDPFGIVEGVRLVKSTAEIAYMRRAAALTDRAVEAAYHAIRPGVRDADVAAVIMDTFYRAGSDTVCWGPIVASGYRAGSAHSTFNGRTIEAGETVFLELTAEVRRYTAPLMRTAILGRPTAEQERVAEVGAEAVQTILRTARPGIEAREVARAAGAVLEPVLSDVVFHHNFGYPVGIGYPGTWIEALGFFIRTDNPRPLAAGMVFHLPMSLRKYGEYGINQSHTMLVTEYGSEALTRTPARLKVLDGSKV